MLTVEVTFPTFCNVAEKKGCNSWCIGSAVQWIFSTIVFNANYE